MKDLTTFTTPIVRLSYPSLLVKTAPQTLDGKGTPTWNICIPYPKQYANTLRAAMTAAAVAEWGDKYKSATFELSLLESGGADQGIKHHVSDGDQKDDPVFAGCLRFTAKSFRDERPKMFRIIDYKEGGKNQMVPITTEDEIKEYLYSGADIAANISAYGTTSGGPKVIAFSLNAVCHIRHNDRLGSDVDPEEAFGMFGAPASLDSFNENNDDVPW